MDLAGRDSKEASFALPMPFRLWNAVATPQCSMRTGQIGVFSTTCMTHLSSGVDNMKVHLQSDANVGRPTRRRFDFKTQKKVIFPNAGGNFLGHIVASNGIAGTRYRTEQVDT